MKTKGKQCVIRKKRLDTKTDIFKENNSINVNIIIVRGMTQYLRFEMKKNVLYTNWIKHCKSIITL